MRPTSVRFDETTYAALVAATKHRGLKSVSEYIRQAVIDRIAWDRALLAMEAGASPGFLADRAKLLDALAQIEQDQQRQEPPAGEGEGPKSEGS